MSRLLLAMLSLLALTGSAVAQTFNSGSTGADGALDLATMSCTECEIQLPPSGVLNYTTVNVPAGKSLKFKRNALNTPVYILAQGAVIIDGIVSLNGGGMDLHGAYDGQIPGPGGFPGGATAQAGLGPGGGVAGGTWEEACGRWVGPLSLVPLVGGSGAAGGGSGGGGAITIASSLSVTVAGAVTANSDIVQPYWYNLPKGSGGAIRLVANSLTIGGRLEAMWNGYSGQTKGLGMIRLEAPLESLSFTGSATPAPIISPINPTLVPAAIPSLAIVSIGGFAVPSYAGNRKDAADMVLPNQLPDPIEIVVQANNIPIGTQVNIDFGVGGGTFTPGTLTGSFASSTASATVSGLNRTGLTYLYVSAIFAVPESPGGANPPGPDQVALVKVSAPPGGRPAYAFLRRDGTEITASQLSQEFLNQYR